MIYESFLVQIAFSFQIWFTIEQFVDFFKTIKQYWMGREQEVVKSALKDRVLVFCVRSDQCVVNGLAITCLDGKNISFNFLSSLDPIHNNLDRDVQGLHK